MAEWLLYGATGYTGKLLIEEAVARGHRPVIAGRNVSKLQPLAEKYGLEYIPFSLDHHQETVKAISNVKLVLHAAGPFVQTSTPMLDACLQVGVHYLDITGEISVFENTFAHDEAAKDRGIVLISGVGFDVVPTDCLIKYVADQLPDASRLEVALNALSGDKNSSGTSAGTMKSGLGMIAKGNLLRRGGELVYADFGTDVKTFRFPMGKRTGMAFPWGDLATAYRTTGIPNITTYLTFPRPQIEFFRRYGYLIRRLMQVDPVRQWAEQQIDKRIEGPTEQQRQQGRSYIYARVSNSQGKSIESWLETAEGYHFTAKSALLSIERVLSGSYRGALSPARAFGADFVLEVPGTKRFDVL
jgi:short subunit dehydrogenase-like uncharacterized protein